MNKWNWELKLFAFSDFESVQFDSFLQKKEHLARCGLINQARKIEKDSSFKNSI